MTCPAFDAANKWPVGHLMGRFGFRSEVKASDPIATWLAENAFGGDIAAQEPDPSTCCRVLRPGECDAAGTASPGLACLPWTTIGIRASVSW